MTGAERIAAERKRQIEIEGYTAEHDNLHGAGELSEAARCYALAAKFYVNAQYFLLRREVPGDLCAEPPNTWPWTAESWKPSTDPVRNLEKAGALIAAAIDRLLRERGRH